MTKHDLSIEERFWAKVYKTDKCWVWTGAHSDGYSMFKVDGHPVKVHKYAWILYNGALPEGLYVLHSCDVKDCVHPKHLHTGTQSDNMKECVQRRRLNNAGEHNPRAILTWKIVDIIRREYKDGMGGVLARRYKTTRTTIWDIVHNKQWVH